MGLRGNTLTNHLESKSHHTTTLLTIALAPLPHRSDIFLNGNKSLDIGDLVRHPILANTLEKIAEGGLQAYQDLGEKLAEDIQQMGGIVTHDDIKNYQ